MTTTTVTAPIALARKARHRKPSQRRNILRGLGVTVAAAAVVTGTAAAGSASAAGAAFYGLTASQVQSALPHGCHTPDGTMAYGDAGTWAGKTYVCAEDGTLIREAAWDHRTHLCHVQGGCTYVPADVRRDLGIRDEPAVMRIGDTTYVWVLTGQGLRTYES